MVSSISRSIPSPPPRPSPPSYHHYVSSLLHRRWIRTCVVLYLVCYAEAWLVTTKRHVLWSIFSAAPAKALLVWFCSMPVLIMRIQLVHLGAKSRPSAAHDVGHRLGSFNTYAAALAYMFSAWTFVVLYMFTSDHGDNGDDLGITTSVDGRSYERPRLNERFLYLLFLSLWTGIVHTVYHLSTDKDRVDLPPVSKQLKENKVETVTLEMKQNILMNTFMREGKGVAVQAGKQALFTAVSGMFAYLFVRKSAWRYTLRVARLFFRISTIPEPYSWPVGILFFIRTLWITLLIFMMWETAHAAFHLYFTMEPLKDGQVLSEGSADPNGTLVTGFKQRNKPFTQAIAFWELVYITFNQPSRRKSFFMDIDRPVKIWDEIMNECLYVIQQAKTSIQKSGQLPVASAPATSIPVSSSSQTASFTNNQIPMKNLYEDMIFLSPPREMPDTLRKFQAIDGKPLGSHVTEKLAPHAPDLKQNAITELTSMRKSFIRSTAGKPFRQTVERKTAELIPNVRLQVDAAVALSKLVISSMTEDDFGLVQRHIGTILEKFFDTIDALEKYISRPPIHWTDTDASDEVAANEGKTVVDLKDPKQLLEALRAASREVVVAYQPFLDDLNLSLKVGKKARTFLVPGLDE